MVSTSRPRSIALFDMNNFYVSCERLFRPDLLTRPVIVLSSNDGCAVSRSNEAKAAGVKMGDPAFKIKDLIKEHGIEMFSSNFVLYANLSNRVMSIMSEYTYCQEIYSIDESFIELTDFDNVTERAHVIRNRIIRDVGIPCCGGIGPSKTLSKLMNFVAKRHPRSKGIFNYNDLTSAQVSSVLSNIPASEIWGIGRKLTQHLLEIGIETALQLRDADIASMRKRFGVIMEQKIRELRGEACLEIEEVTDPKKQMINSRSFGQSVTELHELQAALAHFVSNVAKKLRDQHSLAGMMQVFILTDRFHPERPQYMPSICLPLTTPTANTMTLQKLALAGLDSIYKIGFEYKKAGVILSEFCDSTSYQGDLFCDSPTDDEPELMKALDVINARYGRGTIKISQDGSTQKWKTKQERKSPDYTTNWSDLPTAFAQ